MADLIIWTTFHFKIGPTRTIGAYQIASWLRNYGYSVKVIDFCHAMTTDQLVQITEKHISKNTLAIGVSSTFWNSANDSVERICIDGYIEPDWVINARTILDKKYNIKWLLGGDKAERNPLRFKWIKFLGNAEDTLLKWMNENSNNKVKAKPFDVRFINNIFVDEDYIQPDETLPIELGRGCMFKCKFCSYPLMGKKPGTYLRDSNLIREEFIRNYNEFGTTNYFFLDDTVNENDIKIKNLADISQSLPFKLNWTGYNRLDMIATKPESAQWLKDSGLKSAYFGIESFNPDASTLIGKGWNGRHGKNFLLHLKELWKSDISWTLSLIVGLIGESKEQLYETAQWCIENDMYHWMFFPLYIDRSPDKVWKSEFDMNHTKYGYHFIENDKSYIWNSEMWNSISAYKVTNELNEAGKKYQKIASWTLLGLSSLGYSIDELMKTKIIDLPLSDIKNKTNLFIQNYVNYQLYIA